MLFGGSILDVMPSDILQFSSKVQYEGYALHFAMDSQESSENDLVIQAMNDREILTLLPQRVCGDSFPAAFRSQFVHWFDIRKQCIEFRPIDNPWNHCSRTWTLRRDEAVGGWTLSKDGTSLVSMSTDLADDVTSILSPLKSKDEIHIMFAHIDGSSPLDIELPKLQLGFQLIPGQSSLISRQHRGMMVDPCQRLDTLVGLQNRLVLKDEETGQRLVLIPEGRISMEASLSHVRVTIDRASANRVHAYDIDSLLCRLVDNGSLQSKLLLWYLHAVTSFCLSDPLTRMTGTEQALAILKSAAVSSFDQLTKENLKLLSLIGELTPGRSYYPRYEHVMESIGWSSSISFFVSAWRFLYCRKSNLQPGTESPNITS